MLSAVVGVHPHNDHETYLLLQFIIEKLNLIQTSSKDLIQRYLTELEGQQKYIEIGASLRQGTLHMSVGYLIDKGVIEVSIIQAKNLPGKGTHLINGTAVLTFGLKSFRTIPVC